MTTKPTSRSKTATRADGDRGQAHTLEGLSAALVVVLGVFLALEAVTMTPSTATTASQYLQKQTGNGAEGVLAAADEGDSLRTTVLYWNTTANQFHNQSGRGYYVARGPPTTFGAFLNESFDPRRIAFNVNLYYLTESGARNRRRLVYSGHPNEDAVTASRFVTLYDDDELRNAEANRSGVTLLESSGFYAPDTAPNSTLYNVVEVEVVVWQS